jgi:hypothetical protein
MHRVKSRLLVLLAAAMPSLAKAEAGWGDLPGVLAYSTLALTYAAAAHAIGWLIGLTILAWIVHLRFGKPAGLTTSTLPPPLPSYRRPNDLQQLRWLLPSFHIALTIATVAALLVLGIGKSMGLQIRNGTAIRASILQTDATPDRPVESWIRYSPNQKPWPPETDYLPGMAIQAQGGQGEVMVDNTSGSNDLYLKLCPVAEGSCAGLRHAYVAKGQAMLLKDVAPGSYELRYRDLKFGIAKRSRPFTFIADEAAQQSFAPGDLRTADDFNWVPDNAF